MKHSTAPFKQGEFVVTSQFRSGKSYVAAPPGWVRKSNGTGYYTDGSAGCEHTHNPAHAYRFSKRNAEVVAANCRGTIETV